MCIRDRCEDDENAYRIRSVADKGSYLYGVNDKLSWSGNKKNAMRFTIAAGDPTSYESIADAAEGIKVIAGNGTIEIQGAAGKMVSVTNVLGTVSYTHLDVYKRQVLHTYFNMIRYSYNGWEDR